MAECRLPWANMVLMERMMREKKVVVPTRIQTKCPNRNQETNAPHSSAFQGRMLRIENHLKRTLSRSPKPLAAANSSSLVGRCGIFGRCMYLYMEFARDSCSGTGGSVGWLAADSCAPDCSPRFCCAVGDLTRSPSFLSAFELPALFPATREPPWTMGQNPGSCRARRVIFAFCRALPEKAESATAVHVVTTDPVEEGLALTARRSSPPEVQCRTLFGENRA